jgi:hypothetical protein
METLLVNKLKFQWRGWSGIDGDESTDREIKCRKSKRLRRRVGDGPVPGAKRRGVLLVPSPQNSFPCISVSLAMTPKE